jgi:tau tubulin kinase
MELLGKNIASFKKSKGEYFSDLQAYDILLQMLDSIEILHDKGYIHRDIKPTNFVIGIDEKKVYMVDFGLAKVHLDEKGIPITPRATTDFRGTLSYASLNAHNKQELSRRDDLFSFFFMVLDLLNEQLAWRNCNDDKDEIKKKKEMCLDDPENLLLLTTCKNKPEIVEILTYLKTLKSGQT